MPRPRAAAMEAPLAVPAPERCQLPTMRARARIAMEAALAAGISHHFHTLSKPPRKSVSAFFIRDFL